MSDETPEPLCDVDECTEPAVFTYSWEWGQTGVCCAKHLTLLQQKSGQLQRALMFTALVPTKPAPLTRDERAKLIANGIVLEQELEEAKARGLELYRKTGELTIQIQTLTLREREAKAQLADGQRRVAELEEQLLARDREHGELVAELERLRTIAAFVDGMTAPPAAPPAAELGT